MENPINEYPTCRLHQEETRNPPVPPAPPNYPQFPLENFQHPIAEPPPPYPSDETVLEPTNGDTPRLKNGYQRLANDYPPEYQGHIQGASGHTTVVVTVSKSWKERNLSRFHFYHM